jgi:hypothetical protein
MRVCTNCGRAPVRASGLCGACHNYRWRTGRLSTPQDRHRSPFERATKKCSNCRQAPAIAKHGLCDTCIRYLRRTGKQRRTYRRAERCIVCGMPRNRKFARDRCTTCYNYRRRTGQERPRELFSHLYPLGWCECGLPAATVLTLSVSHGHDAFPLCKECAQLEQAS